MLQLPIEASVPSAHTCSEDFHPCQLPANFHQIEWRYINEMKGEKLKLAPREHGFEVEDGAVALKVELVPASRLGRNRRIGRLSGVTPGGKLAMTIA